MDLRQAYYEFETLLTYVARYAPDRPSAGGPTPEAAMKQLFERFSDLRARERDRGGQATLRQCQEELRAGRAAFAKEQEEGRRRMLQALQILEAARAKP